MTQLAEPVVRHWDFPRGVGGTALLVRFGVDNGVGQEQLLVGSGLTAAQLSDPDTEIAARQELAVVRNLAAALPDAGVAAGREYHATTFGILGFAFLSSPTMRDAVAVALRYFDLSFAFSMPRVSLADGQVRLELDDRLLPADVARFLVERDLAAIHTVIDELVPGGVPLTGLTFRFPAPGTTEPNMAIPSTATSSTARGTAEPDTLAAGAAASSATAAGTAATSGAAGAAAISRAASGTTATGGEATGTTAVSRAAPCNTAVGGAAAGVLASGTTELDTASAGTAAFGATAPGAAGVAAAGTPAPGAAALDAAATAALAGAAELGAATSSAGASEVAGVDPAEVDTSLYRAVFGVTPEFGRDANMASFDASYLDRPLPLANSHAVAMCEAQCRELVSRRRARSGFAHDVRASLTRLGALSSRMPDVARQLNISTRTLRRRLEEEGTTFRALLDEVREALAEELLAAGAVPVEDVATRLGYAEASSFIHAFKRWKGVTPTAFAQQRRRSG